MRPPCWQPRHHQPRSASAYTCRRRRRRREPAAGSAPCRRRPARARAQSPRRSPSVPASLRAGRANGDGRDSAKARQIPFRTALAQAEQRTGCSEQHARGAASSCDRGCRSRTDRRGEVSAGLRHVVESLAGGGWPLDSPSRGFEHDQREGGAGARRVAVCVRVCRVEPGAVAGGDLQVLVADVEAHRPGPNG
jgi:hypothetical protein